VLFLERAEKLSVERFPIAAGDAVARWGLDRSASFRFSDPPFLELGGGKLCPVGLTGASRGFFVSHKKLGSERVRLIDVNPAPTRRRLPPS
jgi:hypothetical protein